MVRLFCLLMIMIRMCICVSVYMHRCTIQCITIDEVQNQSFIMECTSCQRPVTLIDVRGKKIQTQKGLDYKKIDTGLQNLLLCQHSFRVRVRI